jgi:MscS family membrane protein
MNAIIEFINMNVPDRMLKLWAKVHTTPGEVLVSAFVLMMAIVLNWFMRKPVRSWIRHYLYRRRREVFFRFLFYRIDKLLRPLRLFISVILLKISIEIFTAQEMIDTLFFSLYWFFFFWFVYEVIKFLLYTALVSKLKRQRMARMELFNLFLNITRVFIAILLVIFILSHLGVDLTALVTSLGIGGAIIGLSAKDTLTNFFDSIRLVSEDAFRQGDWIETRDLEGFVTEMGLSSTKIRTFDNAMVTVPNSRLVNDYIKNWSRRMVGRRIKFHIRIKYTQDMGEVERVIYEIYEMLHRHPDIVNENKLPYLKSMKMTYEDGLFNLDDKYGVRRTLLVYLDELDKYSMNILVYAFSISVNWEEWLRVKQNVIGKIMNIIEESELELAIPVYEVKATLEKKDMEV